MESVHVSYSINKKQSSNENCDNDNGEEVDDTSLNIITSGFTAVNRLKK